MNRRGFLAGIAGAGAALAVRAQPAAASITPTIADPPGPYPDGTYAMWCLGDSRTAGSTADPANGIAEGTPGLVTGNGYRAHLNQLLNYYTEYAGTIHMTGSLHSGDQQLLHDGHPGWTTTQINNLVTTAVTGLAPQFIILQVGINDFADPTCTWDQVINRLGTILDKLLAWSPWTRVVLCEEIPCAITVNHLETWESEQQAAINANLPGLAATRQGRVTIARTGSIDQSMLDFSGVHPTDNGYQWAAWLIADALGPWLGKDTGNGGGRHMPNYLTPPGSLKPTWIMR